METYHKNLIHYLLREKRSRSLPSASIEAVVFSSVAVALYLPVVHGWIETR